MSDILIYLLLKTGSGVFGEFKIGGFIFFNGHDGTGPGISSDSRSPVFNTKTSKTSYLKSLTFGEDPQNFFKTRIYDHFYIFDFYIIMAFFNGFGYSPAQIHLRGVHTGKISP